MSQLASPRAVVAAVVAERALLAVSVADRSSPPPISAALRSLVIATAAVPLSSSTPTAPSPALLRSAAAAVVVAAWEPPAKRSRKALETPVSAHWTDSASCAAFEWNAGGGHSPVSTASTSSLSIASLASPPLSASYAAQLDRRTSLPMYPFVASSVAPHQQPLRISSAPPQSRTLSGAASQGNLHARLQRHPAIQLIQQRLGAEQQSPDSSDGEEDEDDDGELSDEAVDDDSSAHLSSLSDAQSFGPPATRPSPEAAPLVGSGDSAQMDVAYSPPLVPLHSHSSSIAFARSPFSPSFHPFVSPSTDAPSGLLLPSISHVSTTSSTSVFYSRDGADASAGFVARPHSEALYDELGWDGELYTAPSTEDEPWHEWLDLDQHGLARDSQHGLTACNLY